MPALSKKQQKFMGIVRSIQKGEQPASKFTKKAQDVAKDMEKKSVKKFASTKHKGLPMKKEQQYGTGDIVKDVNPTCPHYGAMGKVKKVKPNSVVFVVKNKGDNFEPGQELEKSHDQMKKVNEMSAKSKKIINKLNKKEKDMFMDMVDMMGFDQVMADYKRDKKAFKQALKDMTENVNESVIKERVGAQQFNKNFEIAMNLLIKQANNLKGSLAKHPIKRNVNKLKAFLKLYKRFIAPSVVEKDRSLDQDFDFTEIKKKLADGKFKSTLEYSIMSKLGGSSYRSNSFYFLDDKEQELLDRIYGGLRKIVNVMDKAQLENINEDGHTDVASSKRKVMIMVQDSNKLLNKLNGMNKEDSLPSWWTDKITLSQNYLAKATDYITNPVESVNEGKGVEKVLKMANDHSFGKLGGRTVDALSAGLFKGVYDKASQNAKDKINKMNEKQLYVFMTKLWSKFGNQVRIG